ncbi:glycosyltransferase family 39 protein [uncultured Kocuria sp.]|uniref:glycosyltransferase family 39 protein n=1 Tax=uncultured Kocuria sp. TaxID=259305 RepID=UPI002599152D|nr:glycosyltransferase family 39 protein [uncultured Kocuria sp.]MCT1367026.1 glycosyltransferase family 39 protein [Rothia sp. p3-SID1597]
MSAPTTAPHLVTKPQSQEPPNTMTHRTRTSRRWALFTPRDGDPRWARPAVALMMIGTAVLYLWNLTISQYGNSFYAATVRAGSSSWTAMLFGSLDANNGITVDKPPAAYWIPALLARIFGFNSFTVLFPQAVMGIAAVWFLYLAVRRTNGTVAGLIAGTTMAVTPVAVMMFRFNNPDAMLTLCLVLGAYFTIRAIQSGQTGRSRSGWWMLAAGLVIGLAFLVKMLQGFMTIPALVVAFAVAAQAGWLRKIRDVVIAGIGVCLPVGFYATVFALWPEGSRPYMAGTNGNSFWELVMGYNGLARILGQSGGGASEPGGSAAAPEAGGTAADAAGAAMGGAPGDGGTGFGGTTGVLRMFNSGFGPEISWLIPAAVIMMIAGLWFTRFARRTDLTRAALILWGGWLVINAGIFSFMEGTIHPYYVVVLTPAIGALIGIGAVELWKGRAHSSVRWVLSISLLATVVWGFALMQRQAPDWLPWVRWIMLIGGSLTAVAWMARLDEIGVRGLRNGGVILALAALIFGGLGATSWGVATAGNAHSGSIPTSGPAVASTQGGMGGPGGMGTAPGGSGDASQKGGGETNAELTQLLKNAGTKYSAATIGATGAADQMLASDTEVLDIGGWMGSDPYPTLDQFKTMVQNGDIKYFVAGGMGGGGGAPGGSSSSSAIQEWVAAHYQAKTVGGSTVYDLSA